MRRKSGWLFCLLVVVLAMMPGVIQAQAEAWQPWDAKDITTLGDDNTGSTFAISSDLMTPSGVAALQVTPSGTSEETKIAIPISGADLAAWANYGRVELDVYLPGDNSRNPTTFFMGMGDTTNGWEWVGGVFGGVQENNSDWYRIAYMPDDSMRHVDPAGSYMIYLSFFDDTKTPLTEPFYLGSMYLDAPVVVEPESASTGYDAEVQALLDMDDAALVDAVAHATFDFFWNEANPDNGLIKDRSTPDSPASIAAVGFGLAAIPVGIDRGWVTQDEGYQRVLTTLQTFANGGVQGEHGFFYHFVDMHTGERVWDSELSSIDTTLFIAGTLTAGQYFKGTEVETLANQLYASIDWQWMMAGRDMVSMGWRPNGGFIPARWDHFDESLLLYILAIASPTYPAPVEMWAAMNRPVNVSGDFIYLSGDPLFVYQYPLAYLNLRGKEDAFANYFTNTIRACTRQQAFAADNAASYPSFQNGVWGVSASDGPHGYQAYGLGNNDGTVAPYASASCLPFTPEAAVASMRAMLEQYGAQVWREYGFVSAFNVGENWFSKDHIGIDEGDILLMLTNYQDDFVWNLFMQVPNIQETLTNVGFVDSQGDYAVTPAYMAHVR